MRSSIESSILILLTSRNNVSGSFDNFCLAGKSGMEFRIMNRLDIFDLKDQKWREAHIIEIKSNNSNKAI